MFVSLSHLIMFIAVVIAQKQIKLEDIERDNLLSERLTNKQEVLKIEQTQHSSTPDSESYEPSAENAVNKMNGDIVYAQSNTGIGQEYPRFLHSSTIQYVTPQQYENDHHTTPTAISYTHPVHEATNTFVAGSRESLTNTVVPKTAGTPSPYLSQQPSYVYVQAGSKQIVQNGYITYGPPQHSSTDAVQKQQKTAEDDISYTPVENHIQVDALQTNENIPNKQQNFESRVIEYIPLISENPTVLSYIMLVRNPTNAPTYGFSNPPIQYASSTVMPPTAQSNSSPNLSAYIGRTIDATAVLTAPESTAIPTATIQYAQPSLQFNPIEYVSHPTRTSHYYPYPFASPIDIYGSVKAHKHPSSLLDSYVPSSTILAIQRQKNGKYTNRQPIYVPPDGFSSPLLRYSSSLYQQGSHQPGYNTIAYSTAQSYSKRSPKLVTERSN